MMMVAVDLNFNCCQTKTERGRESEKMPMLLKIPLIWFITHNFPVFDFLVCFSFCLFDILHVFRQRKAPFLSLFRSEFLPCRSKKKIVSGMQWMKRGKRQKNVKRSKSPWVKILKVDVRVYDAEPFLFWCVHECFFAQPKKKGYFCRKSWLWRKRVAINILERGKGWEGDGGKKADVFFFLFKACCWLLWLAIHMFIRHKFRESMERTKKSDNT
jgi:hypothetical protein